MNRLIQIHRQDEERAPTLVFEGVKRGEPLRRYAPSYIMSRIWMGVVPPEKGEPGYAAVVGEYLDLDPRQQERRVLLMDEGVALDPADFSDQEQELYGITPESVLKPTLKRLAQAVVALKDIYWPFLCWVPSEGRKVTPADQQAPPFVDFLRRTDGLMDYDPNLGSSYYRRWHPFFSSARRTLKYGLGIKEVEWEDREYNLGLIEALLEPNPPLLQIGAPCKIYLEKKSTNSRRCLGMILSQMELQDLTEELRAWRFSDGYPDPEDFDPELVEEYEADKAEEDHWRRWRLGQFDQPDIYGQS